MELARPKPMAEDGDLGRARLVLTGTEVAAELGLDAEEAEEIGSHLNAFDTLGQACAEEGKAAAIDGGSLLQGARLAPELIFAECDHLGLGTEEGDDLADGEDAASAGERQRAQEDGVDEAEDDGDRKST